VSASVLFGKTTEASFLSLSAPSEQCLATPPADCMHPIRRPGSCASHGIHSLVCLPPALDISATRPLPVTVASNLRQSDTNPTTRSAIVVSHHLDGLLRIAASGVLQPKPNEVRCVSVAFSPRLQPPPWTNPDGSCLPGSRHPHHQQVSPMAPGASPSPQRFSHPSKNPLPSSRTASLRPLPSCRFTRSVTPCVPGDTHSRPRRPNVKLVSHHHARRRPNTHRNCSQCALDQPTSRLCSTRESVVHYAVSDDLHSVLPWAFFPFKASRSPLSPPPSSWGIDTFVTE